MNAITTVSRRKFLKSSALAGGGLVLAFSVPLIPKLAFAGAATDTQITAWLRIASDDSVTVLSNHAEMGQGSPTGIAMLLAEELEADWSKVKIEFAPFDPVYINPTYGLQITGGSSAIRGMYKTLPKVGAQARDMLIAAAAAEWGVSAAACEALNGKIIHKNSGRRLRFGQVAEAAGKLKPPENPKRKPPSEYRLIGHATRRLDIPQKINGTTQFGIDVNIPGMLIATVLQCPVFGGKIVSYDKAAAMAVKGVHAVVELPNCLAVVADTYWQAKKGLGKLNAKHDAGSYANLDSAGVSKMLHDGSKEKGSIARNEGDVFKALSSAAKVVEATYEVPYLNHATMEPMNCTAHVRADSCDIWAPTQVIHVIKALAAGTIDMPMDKIKIHTTYLGGGFGRRLEMDFVEHALLMSKKLKRPIKVIWSREEDMQHGFYRPAALSKLSAGLDKKGKLVAFHQKNVSPSLYLQPGTKAAIAVLIKDSDFVKGMKKSGVDYSSVEGAIENPYGIANLRVDYVMKNAHVPIGFWRSVGNSQNGFFIESFMNELADAAGYDPFSFRHGLLAKHPRHRAVLDLLAEKSGWDRAPQSGRFRGMALHASFGSIVGQVVEISFKSNKLKLHRVASVVDCGIVVNPDQVVAQIQSGIVYGLTAATMGEITLKNGRVVQSNFHDYPMAKMANMPEMDVHIAQNSEAPGGIGEPGVPPLAPALIGAIFAATGKRIRSLPLSKHNIELA